MKKYTANHYFTTTEGLKIADETGLTVITIKAESTNEIAAIARKVLALLNEDYYTKKALIEDNNQMYDWGLLTKDERQQKEEAILSATY